MDNEITINVDIKIPENDFCNCCTYMTLLINLYSQPKCLIFNKRLNYICFDKYEKCAECKKLIENEEED